MLRNERVERAAVFPAAETQHGVPASALQCYRERREGHSRGGCACDRRRLAKPPARYRVDARRAADARTHVSAGGRPPGRAGHCGPQRRALAAAILERPFDRREVDHGRRGRQGTAGGDHWCHAAAVRFSGWGGAVDARRPRHGAVHRQSQTNDGWSARVLCGRSFARRGEPRTSAHGSAADRADV